MDPLKSGIKGKHMLLHSPRQHIFFNTSLTYVKEERMTHIQFNVIFAFAM